MQPCCLHVCVSVLHFVTYVQSPTCAVCSLRLKKNTWQANMFSNTETLVSHPSAVSLQATRNYRVWHNQSYLEPARQLVLAQPLMCQRAPRRTRNLRLIATQPKVTRASNLSGQLLRVSLVVMNFHDQSILYICTYIYAVCLLWEPPPGYPADEVLQLSVHGSSCTLIPSIFFLLYVWCWTPPGLHFLTSWFK